MNIIQIKSKSDRAEMQFHRGGLIIFLIKKLVINEASFDPTVLKLEFLHLKTKSVKKHKVYKILNSKRSAQTKINLNFCNPKRVIYLV